jgi:ABC transporter with metal-binding/Fe-S-binding domain ATP-binding protein
MRVAALISGGKDSLYSIYISLQHGWEVSYLVALVPERRDSWMFHSINLHLLPVIASNIGIPLTMRETKGKREDELKDLKYILRDLPIEGVISGAVASDYQRTRINHVCDELDLKSFAPLWHKSPEQLLRWQVDAGFRFVIVSVSAEGLDRGWLGREIDRESLEEFIECCKRHRIHVTGEGGEFETLVIDCPIYRKALEIENTEIEWKRDYGYLVVKGFRF